MAPKFLRIYLEISHNTHKNSDFMTQNILEGFCMLWPGFCLYSGLVDFHVGQVDPPDY
jgi:hypothetical protein